MKPSNDKANHRNLAKPRSKDRKLFLRVKELVNRDQRRIQLARRSILENPRNARRFKTTNKRTQEIPNDNRD